MNLLIYGEIRHDLPLPDFGGAFLSHMQKKRHPHAYAASLSAWTLLAKGLISLGINPLPEVCFSEKGKPFLTNCPLHFSLSHSGNIAATLISSMPCGVDVELIRPEPVERLSARVLSDDEQNRRADFFQIWTKKEACGKLAGTGLPAQPREMDLSRYENLNLLQKRITDFSGSVYFLTAICESSTQIKETDC